MERVAQQLHDVAVNTVYDRPTVPRLLRAVVHRAVTEHFAVPWSAVPRLSRAEVRRAGLPYVALIRARIAADIMYSPHRPAARLLSRRQLGEHRVADDCIRSSLTDPCFLAGRCDRHRTLAPRHPPPIRTPAP